MPLKQVCTYIYVNDKNICKKFKDFIACKYVLLNYFIEFL